MNALLQVQSLATTQSWWQLSMTPNMSPPARFQLYCPLRLLLETLGMPPPAQYPALLQGRFKMLFFLQKQIFIILKSHRRLEFTNVFQGILVFVGILWSSIVKETCNWLPREKHLVLMSNLWPGCFLGQIFMSLAIRSAPLFSLPR